MDTPDARGAAAAKRVRDEQGHFIKADLSTSGDDLVDFRIHNPLHDPIVQLKALIVDIQKHQTTYMLVMPANFDSSRLHGTRVAVSGMVNMCTHAIRIDTPQNVTVLAGQ